MGADKSWNVIRMKKMLSFATYIRGGRAIIKLRGQVTRGCAKCATKYFFITNDIITTDIPIYHIGTKRSKTALVGFIDSFSGLQSLRHYIRHCLGFYVI
jgi:hypothetical protein